MKKSNIMPVPAEASRATLFSGKACENLLSSQLSKTSLQERTDIMNDLHGVTDLKEETEELLNRCMEEMNQALDKKCRKLPSQETEAFLKAASTCRDYVDRRKVQFLRSKKYDSQRAADGILGYFSKKLELFGEALLVKEIQLKDLEEGAITALRTCLCSVLDTRDRAGRAIFFGALKHNNSSISTRSALHASYYTFMTMLRDEETQRKGVVIVSYANDQKEFVPGRSIEIIKTFNALPFNCRAFHYCMDGGKDVHFAMYLFCRLMENSEICRFKLHKGTHMENIYKLMTFGILRDSLPVTCDGTIDPAKNVMLRLLDSNKLESRDSSSGSTVLVPSPMDILMGRGLRPNGTLGGMRMRQLLEENKEAYDNSSKADKTVLAEIILKQLKEAGCRFLKLVSGGYEECNDTVAREKISHGFRNLRGKGSSGTGTTKKTKTRKRGPEASAT